MNEKYVENLTLAYLHSHEIALKETRNPSFAAETAASVVMIIASVEKQNQPKFDFTQAVLAMAAQARQEDSRNSDEIEK